MEACGDQRGFSSVRVAPSRTVGRRSSGSPIAEGRPFSGEEINCGLNPV